MTGAVLAVRFLLELSALVALGAWGAARGGGTTAKMVFALGLPLAVAIVWAMLVAPKAPVDAPAELRLGLELLIFGGAAGAVASTGRSMLALGFALVVLANGVLVRTLGEA